MSNATASQISRALLWLYGIEVSLVFIVVGLYKAPPASMAHAIKPMLAIAIGALGILALTVLVRTRRFSRRNFVIALVVNLATLVATLGIAELALRTIAVKSDADIQIGNARVPLTWPELVSSNRAAVDSLSESNNHAYLIYDAELGWTVGKSRRSSDGLYYSSAEGIRSPGPGVVYTGTASLHRVAMVGDSHTFSLEVPFAESWEHHLEALLGSDAQLLNFGVDGYGVDQMYLRYMRDVRPWHPDVVVVGFIQHDLLRTTTVYPFVTLGWTGMLIKPRFVEQGSALAVVNAPLLTSDAVLNAEAVFSLPHIDLDPGYKKAEWEYRFDRSPLTLRLLMAIFPRWPDANAMTHDVTDALNARLFAELNAAILRDGATPVFVYIPQINASGRQARAVLERAQLASVDVSACLNEIPEQARKVASGIHYNNAGNEAIARCTAPAIQAALTSRLGKPAAQSRE